MRHIPMFTLLLLLGAHAASAATITARITANVLEPVNIAFPSPGKGSGIQNADDLAIRSSRDLHYELSHQASDVCLLNSDKGSGGKLALAGCETYTINFN